MNNLENNQNNHLSNNESPLKSGQWIEEKTYFSGDLFFKDILHSIKTAKISIWIESYIFNKGVLSSQILEALREAVQKGVRVRVMIDGFGSFFYPIKDILQARKNGIEIRIFRPFPLSPAINIKDGFIHFKKFLKFISNLNRRNHRKMVIIDREKVFLGSMNISDDHLESVMGNNAWRDTGVQLKGEEVPYLNEAYLRAWKKSWSPRATKRKQTKFRHTKHFPKMLRLNYLIRLKISSSESFKELIEQATSKIWITNAYFVPRQNFCNWLKEKAEQGIDVRLLVPAKSDVWLVRLASIAFYQELWDAGVKIFEYQPRILHSKTMLVDRVGMVGSSNLNHRSVLHDLEVDAYLTKGSSVDALENQFNEDLQNSKEIICEGEYRHPLWMRLGAKIILIIRYWL